MKHNNPNSEEEQGNLRLLESAMAAPGEICEMDREVRDAFNLELRKLAEEIVEFHPSLTQLLLSMGDSGVSNPVHGQN